MNDTFIFNPRLEKFKKPYGAIRGGTSVRFSVYVLRGEIRGVNAVFFSEYTGKENRLPLEWVSRDGSYDVFSVETEMFSSPDIIWYHFETETFDGKVFCFGKNTHSENKEEVRSFQLTVFAKEYETPDWFSKGVTYQIFVDRFHRGLKTKDLTGDEFFCVHKSINEMPDFLPNEKGIVENRDIFGGDLEGIIEKLPYLEKLSVRTIYLNPIFEAWSNHKYNTADYKKIDRHFGDEETLERLCEEASKFGIRVILDGVFSHTGSDSVYFNKEGRYGQVTGAYRDENSPYRSWYGIGENGGYSSWWGIDTLPQVNELDASFIDYITDGKDSVIAHWMKVGVSGWRLDVADELPDEFISRLKARARSENGEAIVIGEVWEDASTKKAYGTNKKYFTEGVLDGVMNYPLKNAIIDFLVKRISAKRFSEMIAEILENYPEPSLQSLMNIIGTHDTVRVINELSVGSLSHNSKEYRANRFLSESEYALGKRRLYLAAAVQYFFPGSPCIYYGDEIGMEGFEDPFNRRYFTWEDMDDDLLSFYRKLGKIKLSEPALHTANRIEIKYSMRDVVILSREDICIVINRSDACKIFSLSREFDVLLASEPIKLNKCNLLVKPISCCILKCK